MSEKRRALGRGLGALIPASAGPGSADRPVDVFFQGGAEAPTAPATAPDAEGAEGLACRPAQPDAEMPGLQAAHHRHDR